jgi:hypothetical protein
LGLGCVAGLLIVLAATACSSDRPAQPEPATTPTAPPVKDSHGWTRPGYDTKVVGVPTVVDNVALAAIDGGGRVGSEAIDVRTGRVLWQVLGSVGLGTLGGVSPRPIGVSTAAGPVAVDVETDAKSRVLLVGHNAVSGADLWHRAVPAGDDSSAAARTPVACGNWVCLVLRPGNTATLQALNPRSGKPAWSADVNRYTSIVTADDRRIIVGDGVSLSSWSTADGARQWTSSPPGGFSTQDALESLRVGWYELGDVLVGDIAPGELIGVDEATGRVAWRRPGWSALGMGQPVRGGDGITLAARVILAVDARHDVAGLDDTGAPVWKVADDHFWRVPSYSLAWTADLSQVWVGDGVKPVVGRATATGAIVTSRPRVLWTPLLNRPADSALDPAGTVDPTMLSDVKPRTGDTHPPSWAGPVAGGYRLCVDSDGDLTAVRAA